ncbi:protein of unknown function [Taphrina deformans PYCC 5710]|uniref:Uncharacterized protein n=1 Tax=Taphrina deformans (strain PYCC 5710 / ATCC 11124 / CBS 356.35 / IMI 108563 / JCM 9778 / NBRC 8474) TaxID=1097556 RepID=R4X6C6_TAPDE|nr:protein of unknown function [Taphrina deformans PYCC 5710]|eukprot:CCG80604.1 protein of unknown function [Taphrina deformans PYCC 5710]
MPKREEQLTRAMVGRIAVQKRLTDEEIIELERKEQGTGEVVKERYVSKVQQKKDRIAAREAELLQQLKDEEAASTTSCTT